MARADLLLQLVQSGASGDRALFRKTVEAIIAEERSKQHNILADQLSDKLNETAQSNGITNGLSPAVVRNDNRIENIIHQVTPRTLLDRLVLKEDTLALCRELISEQFRSDILRSYNLEPRNRVLLIGPPGNGKTSLAEAIANSLMVPMFTVRYEGIITSYLGETATRLKHLFDFVKTQRCVLFFDEFDAIGKERGDQHETGEIKRVVNSLLLQIDSLPSYVVVISATNHPELLDRAVWRRFQLKISLSKPSLNQIQEYLRRFENNMPAPFGVSIITLAQKLNTLSFSDIENVLKDILRSYVLGLPGSNMKKIVEGRIRQIAKAYKPKGSKDI